MTETPDWPAYRVASDEHLAAIGAFVAAWNEIEGVYQAFIQNLYPHDLKLAIRTFELLGNESRSELIRDSLARYVRPDEYEETLYFLKCASICKDNRNVVVHAHYSPSSSANHIFIATGLDKSRKFVRTHYISLIGLREMADAARITASFGLNVWAAISFRRVYENPSTIESARRILASRLALPDRPPQPRKWDQIREDQPVAPPQPGSSGA
jgi:hypothetical protein